MPTLNDIKNGLPLVLGWFRDHLRPPSPAPVIVAHPDGKQALLVIDQGEGRYVLQKLEGQDEKTPSHVFDRFDDLVVYLQHRAKSDGVSADKALVCVDHSGIDVVFADFGRDAEVVVEADLPLHPYFEPWAKSGRAMDPHTALNFLRQLPGELVGTIRGSADQVDLGDYFITQMLKIDVNVGGKTEIQMARNGLVQVARKGEERTVSATIPDAFRIKAPLYDGISVSHDVDILVHLTENGGVPFVAFEVARRDHLLRQGRKAVVEELRAQLGEGWCVALGEASAGQRKVGPREASLLTPAPSQGA